MALRLLRTWIARGRALARRRGADRALDEELQAFVDATAARLERQGLAPAQARRAARIEAGGLEQVKEATRDVQAGASMAAAVRDARYGARVIWRSPGFALVVVLTIAIGIGANTAIFSVIHGVLLQRLPYPEPDRLVAIEADTRGLPSAQASDGPMLDLRRQSRLLTGVSTIDGRDTSITIDGVMERVAGARVSDDLLPILGAAPLVMGRLLDHVQDLHGVTTTGVVISHELWQRRFHGDPGVLSRHFEVNNDDVQVVGVMRPDFRVYLPSADHVEEHIDVWLPATYSPGLLYRGAVLVARLAGGATIAQAQAECDAAAASSPGGAGGEGMRVAIRPLEDVVTRDVRPALAALGAAVGFVLLIACVNVANLMLARAKAREHELAVRRALGATRFRLLRQLLAENLVFTVLGGCAGVVLARAGLGIMTWLRPSHLPRQPDIAIDPTVLAWTTVLTIGASVVFGLVPAMQLSASPANRPWQSGRAASLMAGGRRWHRGLVIAEVALSIVPLVATGLMLRTFSNLMNAPVGFDPSGVIAARVPLSLAAFRTVADRSGFYREAAARVAALPGVDAASVGGPMPFMPAQITQRYRAKDDPRSVPAMAIEQVVMPGYFATLRIPFRAGRDFTGEDITAKRHVVIVDERLATRLWHGNAIGRRLAIGDTQSLDIVGVVAPIRALNLRDADTPALYVPYPMYEIEETLVVRTRLPIATMAPAVRQTIEALGPGRVVSDVRSLSDIMAASVDDTRFTLLVLSGFAAVALLLAGIGLYGTLAYLISQRTREFGVRRALGAPAWGLIALVVSEGSLLTGAGTVLGFGGAMLMTRSLAGMLYGVAPFDRETTIGVLAIVAAVALIAVIRPAWRAARVDPVRALRAE